MQKKFSFAYLVVLFAGAISLGSCAAPGATSPSTQTANRSSITTASLTPDDLSTATVAAGPTRLPDTATVPRAVSPAAPENRRADVQAVQVSGEPGAYSFSVTIKSPDSGCGLYADWWEVVSLEGELLYRRVLLHSHVNEQPFTRSGGPVPVDAGQTVWVRAHMRPGGYGGQALHGSVEHGFEPADPGPDFAEALADQEPLPEDCAF